VTTSEDACTLARLSPDVLVEGGLARGFDLLGAVEEGGNEGHGGPIVAPKRVPPPDRIWMPISRVARLLSACTESRASHYPTPRLTDSN